MKLWIKETRTLDIPQGLMAAEDMQTIGLAAVKAIRTRVKHLGLNAQDEFMAPYTPEYATRKQALGRVSQYRDLTLTGKMLSDLHAYGASARVVSVGVTSPRSQPIAAGNQQRSGWLGVSPSDATAIMDRLKARLAIRLRSLRFTKRGHL